eukprot:CAMPEP_0206463404 /NCGR_PEP_ID=MMETSP0324_2-20121206/26580_1 /ASSEMBLY_ACC=CAM_ASM_000836 /TAXON_ID=2866 /ORGANISM="Crypthecodinium cohnii, Strain Seligo" /LENGTH=129 /DNA_ID=CAMNT_0053935797 /DNA_START=88 /DNA_END=477 /DNA_ORIENTATION=-
MAGVKTITKDSFAELELHSKQNVDLMAAKVLDKVKESSLKDAQAKFMKAILMNPGIRAKMDLKEVETLHKTCKEIIAKREKSDLEALKAKVAKEAEEEKRKKEERIANGEEVEEDFDYEAYYDDEDDFM